MPVMESVTYGNMSYMQLAEEMAKVHVGTIKLNKYKQRWKRDAYVTKTYFFSFPILE